MHQSVGCVHRGQGASFECLRSGSGRISILMGSGLHSAAYARQKPVERRGQNESPTNYGGDD